ncbi:MAG: hypothetical protein VXB01_14880 [Opitutae bacterium]
MKVNQGNIPDSVYHAIMYSRDLYNPGKPEGWPWERYWSATGLNKPPLQAELQKRNRDQIEEDAWWNLYSMEGTMLHQICEDAAKQMPGRYIPERRWYASIKVENPLNGQEEIHLISSQIDLIDIQTWESQDYKRCTASKAQKGASEDWIQQANVGNFCFNYTMRTGIDPMSGSQDVPAEYGLQKGDYQFSSMSNILIIRDHAEYKSTDENDYPETPIVKKDYTHENGLFWPLDRTERWIRSRIQRRIEARVQKIGESVTKTTVPVCTPSEQWARDPEFRVMIKSKSRSKFSSRIQMEAENECDRLKGQLIVKELTRGKNKGKFKTEPESDVWETEDEAKDVYFVEKIEGERVRCSNRRFCNVNHLCPFNKEYEERKNSNES